MSLLRLLSPRGSAAGPSRQKHVSDEVSLELHVPSYGGVWMNPPGQNYSFGPDVPPRNDVALSGELEVIVPAGLRKRCKSLSVTVRIVAKLDMGPGRMGEEDVIFERGVELGEAEGVWLEGSQRFAFTIILPDNVATHDWHHNARILCWLYGELEGLPEEPKPAKKHKDRSRSGTPSRSSTPLGLRGPFSSPGELNLSGLIIREREGPGGDPLPQAPPYETDVDGAPGGQWEWIRGKRSNRRVLFLVYNPNPNGGVSQLDETNTGFAEGLGPYEIRLISDVWSICGPLQCRISLPSLSPTTTVFCARVVLSQSHAISSPRDPPGTKPITSTRYFTILEKGSKPPKEHVHPGSGMPALWRGTGVGGKDEGEWEGVMQGRLPNDDLCRPSTVPELMTPVKVSHQLVTEIYFSVYGEDPMGQSMRVPGPGGLRLLRASRLIVLPSCAFIPKNVRLPTYEEGLGPTPCPHRRPLDIDSERPSFGWQNDVKLAEAAGSTMDRCPLCRSGMLPRGTAGWRDCACGMTLEEVEERSRRMMQEDEEERGRRRGSEGVSVGEEYARGRKAEWERRGRGG